MGEVEIERGYYYCEKCGYGLFALDEQLKLWDRNWSESLAKEMVWLAGAVASYEKAEEIMLRVAHISLSDSAIWRQVQRWGAEFKALADEQKEKATELPKRGEIIAPQSNRSNERLGGAMDGVMVPILEEGWKELKVGCLFDIQTQLTFDKESGEFLELGHAVNNSYVAHLGGPEPFGQLMWAEAKNRGWEEVFDTQIIGDGASWIWNQTKEHFFDSYQTIDWFHACEHLHQAASLYHPHSPDAAQRWFNQAETALFQGHADQIALDLRANNLHSAATYFEHNKRRMQYLELRENGFLIGSGMIESGAKQFKARFGGSGMRWSRQGFEHLLPIRASVMSLSFDSLWNQVYNSPLN